MSRSVMRTDIVGTVRLLSSHNFLIAGMCGSGLLMSCRFEVAHGGTRHRCCVGAAIALESDATVGQSAVALGRVDRHRQRHDPSRRFTRNPYAPHPGAAEGITKEQQLVPHLAPHLPVPVPVPVVVGEAAFGYPWQWSVHPWVPG